MRIRLRGTWVGLLAVMASWVVSADAAAATAAKIVDAGLDSGDAALPEVVDTATQRAFRAEYISRIVTRIYKTLQRDTKTITDDEVHVIDRHWRQSMRLLRIRDVALFLDDRATVARAEDLLNSVDGRFFSKLEKLAAAAPDKNVSKDGGTDAASGAAK